MAVANTPFNISKDSQAGVIAFLTQSQTMINQQWNVSENMRKIDLSYMRENDLTIANQRAKLANAYGDADKYQNIVMPVVMPAVESAVVYQSSVFLTGNPIFRCSI
jgi:predicted alpha/beta superfamily hydrolase